jgi:methyltransferase (TIGR00027 family)
MRGLSAMMVARTLAIDASVREAASPQVVILGAGLDGRAWRIAELRDAVVFEVDHPDTQRDKKSRIAALTQTARDVRFVPVDFTKDDLERALDAAGHDPSQRTTWIWEGVVMYLTRREVEATLAAIARRSATGSRLVIMYNARSWSMWVAGFVVRGLGEPFRSAFPPSEMAQRLHAHGFDVARDEELSDVGARLGRPIAAITERIRHQHVVTADRTR